MRAKEMYCKSIILSAQQEPACIFAAKTIKQLCHNICEPPKLIKYIYTMKEMLYAVRCLKSNEDMILALVGQFKRLSHEPEKFR